MLYHVSHLHHPEFFFLLHLHLLFSALFLITPSNLLSLPNLLTPLSFSPHPPLRSFVSPFLYHSPFHCPPLFLPTLLNSAPPQRAPGASPSAHNISSATVTDRTNFSRGVGIRSTFHAGQQRGARDQQGSAYPGGPASPSLSHGNSQARRTHGATGIFSKFTSKFVRR